MTPPMPSPDADTDELRLLAAELRRSRSTERDAETVDEAAATIERLRAALKASEGYMLNAKIDLETNTPKRTAIQTIEGGLKVVRAALHPTTDETKHADRS